MVHVSIPRPKFFPRFPTCSYFFSLLSLSIYDNLCIQKRYQLKSNLLSRLQLKINARISTYLHGIWMNMMYDHFWIHLYIPFYSSKIPSNYSKKWSNQERFHRKLESCIDQSPSCSHCTDLQWWPGIASAKWHSMLVQQKQTFHGFAAQRAGKKLCQATMVIGFPAAGGIFAATPVSLRHFIEFLYYFERLLIQHRSK